ncbi:Endonuclease/exonuclease/phosphatase, partial [Mycena floridula]
MAGQSSQARVSPQAISPVNPFNLRESQQLLTDASRTSGARENIQQILDDLTNANGHIDEEGTSRAQNRIEEILNNLPGGEGNDTLVNHEGTGNSVHPGANETNSQIPTKLVWVAGRRRRIRASCKKNTKAAIKIAALNINGNGKIDPNHPGNRWNHINQLMRDKRIGILIVGEAHLNRQRHKRLEDTFGKRLKIWYSKDPTRDNAKGLAVVFNKELTNTQDVKIREIIPGQALLVMTNWHGNSKLTILGVYADNKTSALNEEVWEKIETFFRENPSVPKPDVLAGDLNMVEDETNRLPPRFETQGIMKAFDSMKTSLDLIDGWRDTYPDTFDYTFTSRKDGHKSRLDRIYMKQETLDNSRDWLIEMPGGVITDHLMVSAMVSCETAPRVGRGRWTIPHHIMKDKKLLQEVKAIGRKAIDKIEHLQNLEAEWSAGYNTQTIYEEFKEDLRKIARKRAKAVMPRLQRQIEDLADERERILNDKELSKESKMEESGKIEDRLRELTEKKHRKIRASVRFRNQIEGETMTKSWTRNGKEKKPRDFIYNLNTGNTNRNGEKIYLRNSEKMSEKFRDYHDELQTDGVNDTNAATREEDIERILEKVDTRLPNDRRDELSHLVSYEEIADFLDKIPKGKSPGIDGIFYELWRTLKLEYERDSEANKNNPNNFDATLLLQLLYNDIQRHGIAENTNFTRGWMCPLYKKNDRAEAANYRPITLLNSDYKILTKILSIRL